MQQRSFVELQKSKVLRDTKCIEWVVFCTCRIEQPTEAPFVHEPDVANMDLAKFARFGLP